MGLDLKRENPQFREDLYFAISNPIRLKFYKQVEDRDRNLAVKFQLLDPLDQEIGTVTKLQKLTIIVY